MSHFTYNLNEILDNNYLFQEKEEPLFSGTYLNLNSVVPIFSSNSYTFIYHKLTSDMYNKYLFKLNQSLQRRRSFYIK